MSFLFNHLIDKQSMKPSSNINPQAVEIVDNWQERAKAAGSSLLAICNTFDVIRGARFGAAYNQCNVWRFQPPAVLFLVMELYASKGDGITERYGKDTAFEMLLKALEKYTFADGVKNAIDLIIAIEGRILELEGEVENES